MSQVPALIILAAAASLCLAILMWVGLILARAYRVRRQHRRRAERARAAAAIEAYVEGRDWHRLVASLSELDPAPVVDVAARAMPALAAADRPALGGALARSGAGRYMARRMPNASEGDRVTFCELLAWIPGERPLRLLKRALKDRAPAVRIAGAIALAVRGEPLSPSALLRKIGRRAATSRRLELLFAIQMDRYEAEIVDLAQEGRAGAELRSCAWEALRRERPERYKELRRTIGADAPPPVAIAAIRAVEPGADADALLARLFESASPLVRREAAERAPLVGSLALSPALRTLANDPDPLVAAAAARSSWHFAPPVRPYLVSAAGRAPEQRRNVGGARS